MSKKILAILGVGVVVISVAAFFITSSKDPSPQEVFKSYLNRLVSSETYATEEKYSGTGSEVTLRGKMDLQQKSFLAYASLSCVTKSDGNDVNMTMSFQMENASMFLRIDSANGNILDSEGNRIDLDTAFSKIKGQWYKFDEDDPSIKAQLDSGVMVSEGGIMAPSYDANRVVSTLLNKNVFTIKSTSKEDGMYVINVDVSRTAYGEVLKDVLPNLGSQDLVLEAIFEESQSTPLTLILAEDGSLKRERNDSPNLCVDLIQPFTGTQPTDLASRVNGEIIPRQPREIKIDKIQNSKPFSEYPNDVVFN